MAPSPSRMARGGTQFIASAFAFGRDKCDHPAQRTTAGRRRYGCDPTEQRTTAGRRRYGCDTTEQRTTAGRTPLATACAAHCVRGICRYGCTLVAMAPSPSRMARVEGSNSLRPRFRSRQARPSRAAHDGGAHPSCDRLRGSLRSGDMSLRAHHRGDGALAIVPAPPRLLVFVV